MKKLVAGLVLGFAAVVPAVGQLSTAKLGGGKLDAPAKKEVKAQKMAYRHRVLQVLPDGLLMSAQPSPYLVKGYPADPKVTDGVIVKFFGVDTGKTFQYADVAGAMRTVKVIRYVEPLIGK